MTSQEIVQLLQAQFPSAIVAAFPADKHPRIHINAKDLRPVAEFLRNDPRLQFDWLANLTGVDYVATKQMAVVYDLFSLELKHTFAVKAYCPREEPNIPSVQDIWSAANWHEREAYDMFGIAFPGHPNLTRILCVDDWEGFPLRKDYVFPKEYHGIPGNPGMEWDPSNKPKPAPAAKPAAPAAKPTAQV